jgi:hypothetical protein
VLLSWTTWSHKASSQSEAGASPRTGEAWPGRPGGVVEYRRCATGMAVRLNGLRL